MDDSSMDWFDTARLFFLAILGGILSIFVTLVIGMVGGPLGILSLLIVGPLTAYSLGQKTREELLGLLLGVSVGMTGGYGTFLWLSVVGAQATGQIVLLPQDALGWFGYIIAPIVVCGFMGRQGTDLADVY